MPSISMQTVSAVSATSSTRSEITVTNVLLLEVTLF